MSLTITAQQNDENIRVSNLTFIPNTACNISYELTLLSTESLGYISASQAYDISSWKLSSAVENGDFDYYWSYAAAQMNVIGALSDASSVFIDFGSYDSMAASTDDDHSSSSSSSSRSASTAVIVSTVMLTFACLPFICCFLVRFARWSLGDHRKIFVDEETNIQMVDARYIEAETTDPVEVITLAADVHNLPQARPVSCVVAEVV